MRSFPPMRPDFPVFRCKARTLVLGAMDSMHDSGDYHSGSLWGDESIEGLSLLDSDIGKDRLGRVPAEQGLRGRRPTGGIKRLWRSAAISFTPAFERRAIDRWQYPVPCRRCRPNRASVSRPI